ncbi:MAG: hypothetical protein J6C54_02845 [Lachnospiraceae bacterium]|nr:hypothetical protein [Lachnospiraceae bacterium]
MEVVLNDYAIAGQFRNIEDFVDSLVENTFPVLDCLRNKSTILWKSQETYSKYITERETIYNFLCSQKFYGFPEAQKLRRLLGELVDEPFWESDSKTDRDSFYSCDYIGEFNGEQPNCFSEALERDGVTVSFEHKDFMVDEVYIKKNRNSQKIFNLYNKVSAGRILFLKDLIGFSELLLSGIRDQSILFYANHSKYYADEYYDNGKLSKNDALAIQKDFQVFAEGRENGNVLGRFTDAITYKNITYCEFRTTITNSREFRLFYFVDGNKTVFLDSLIKTTQATPDHVKERTYTLIKQYKKEAGFKSV